MQAENSKNSAFRALALLGIVLVVVAAVWLVVLFARPQSTVSAGGAERVIFAPTRESTDSSEPEPEPEPETIALAQLEPHLLIDDDLGTGSREFSGVALNEDMDRLMIADDSNMLFEFDLDDEGVPIVPMRRAIRVQVGGGDIEGISWIDGQRYVIAHEDDGSLTVVDVDDDIGLITADHLVQEIDTSIREIDGNGLEGVAAVPAGSAGTAFLVVDERPPTVVGIDPDGSIAFTLTPDFGLSDVSDIYVSPTGVVSVLSDEAGTIVDFVLEAGVMSELDRMVLHVESGAFEQPEGLVRSSDGSRLYVVGEGPGPQRFAFGLWTTAQ